MFYNLIYGKLEILKYTDIMAILCITNHYSHYADNDKIYNNVTNSQYKSMEFRDSGEKIPRHPSHSVSTCRHWWYIHHESSAVKGS